MALIVPGTYIETPLFSDITVIQFLQKITPSTNRNYLKEVLEMEGNWDSDPCPCVYSASVLPLGYIQYLTKFGLVW